MPGCLFACKGLFFLREPCYNLNDPQGNGKTKPIFALFNVSPRKGTEAFPCSIINGDITTEPTHTPQGDGKKYPHTLHLNCFPEPTHTPQGDGMTIANATSMAIKDLTHTPQGDDNRPSVLSNVLHYIENQLTPRKGTETPKRPRTCSGQDDLTHTPQGDGSPTVPMRFTHCP